MDDTNSKSPAKYNPENHQDNFSTNDFKITYFHTMQKYLSYLQNLARSVNIPCLNITLDVDAAINAYKTIWDYPVEYSNVIIHHGSFHFIKENFRVKPDIYNYCI